jgi:serine/threonine protein kinase
MSRIGVTHRYVYLLNCFRDLKPENIFVKNGVLKIGDFGFAKNEEGQDLMSTIVGSPAYMAPQILVKRKYNYKCDIWSLGVLAFEMLTGNLPFVFKSQNLEDMYKDIKNTVLDFSSVKVKK